MFHLRLQLPQFVQCKHSTFLAKQCKPAPRAVWGLAWVPESTQSHLRHQSKTVILFSYFIYIWLHWTTFGWIQFEWGFSDICKEQSHRHGGSGRSHHPVLMWRQGHQNRQVIGQVSPCRWKSLGDQQAVQQRWWEAPAWAALISRGDQQSMDSLLSDGAVWGSSWAWPCGLFNTEHTQPNRKAATGGWTLLQWNHQAWGRRRGKSSLPGPPWTLDLFLTLRPLSSRTFILTSPCQVSSTSTSEEIQRNPPTLLSTDE